MINFSKVERTVKELKSQLAAGKIDQDTFESRLLEMIDVAADGHYWMFGHKSERWYRHNGQEWVLDVPSKLLPPQDNVEPLNTLNPTTHHLPPLSEQSVTSKWHSVNWAWFMVSLIILALIAWVVYTSSLV